MAGDSQTERNAAMLIACQGEMAKAYLALGQYQECIDVAHRVRNTFATNKRTVPRAAELKELLVTFKMALEELRYREEAEEIGGLIRSID